MAVSPVGILTNLFHTFGTRRADLSGFGLGLAFSRWGVEANHGRIYARNLPGRGCIFTVDLPRFPFRPPRWFRALAPAEASRTSCISA